MITFSNDPKRAEHEMHAVIFYLVTFGYIDGDFDASEKGLVREVIRNLIEHRATTAMPDATDAVKADVIAKYTKHFHEVLEGIDQNHPKAQEIRSLVGEQLPGMVDSYRRIPAQMRTEQRGGRTPDEQLTESLRKISGEIDSITRQLAEGNLDDLAIKTRYLDYKYGGAIDVGGAALEEHTKGPA